MSITSQNEFIMQMAKQLEAGLSNACSPMVEDYLEAMDGSVEAELTNLRWLQEVIKNNPDTEHTQAFQVLEKWLLGLKQADMCLASMGLNPSAVWAQGYQARLA